MDLFQKEENAYQPLADKMRPNSLDEFFGQTELVGEGSPISEMIKNDNVS